MNRFGGRQHSEESNSHVNLANIARGDRNDAAIVDVAAELRRQEVNVARMKTA
jgi:hypothetical protein